MAIFFGPKTKQQKTRENKLPGSVLVGKFKPLADNGIGELSFFVTLKVDAFMIFMILRPPPIK